MKIIDKVLKENPCREKLNTINYNCPSDFEYKDIQVCNYLGNGDVDCETCWNREIEEPKKKVEQIENNELEQLAARIGKNMKDMINSLLKENTTQAILRPTTHSDKLNIENNNLTKMAKKLNEEVGEVIEAVATSHHLAIQELFDVIQVALNMLNFIEKEYDECYGVNIPGEIKKHNKKLEDRGWEFDNNLSLKISTKEEE